MKILIAASCQRAKKDNISLKLQEILKQRRSLALCQLAALTPKEYDLEIIDEGSYTNIDTNKKYDLVAISCLTPYAIHTYEIADIFRKKGIPVVLGGFHPSALPEEAKQHADSVVIGEAEASWPQLLKDFEEENLKDFYKQKRPVDPKFIPPAKRDARKGFIRTEEIQATRGCPHRCEFCSIQNTEGHYFRKRPIDNVIEEIKNIKANSLFFDDASLTIDPEYTKSLFSEMKKLNKSFQCHGNIDILGEDDELLELSKEAGCHTWYIGFESICQESLENIGKKTNIVENYSAAIKKIRKYGIAVRGMFVFGFDNDSPDIFEKTYKAIKEWKIDTAYFFVLTPFPGTPIFKRLENEGRIITKDWSKYAFGNVVFEPENMSRKELFEKTQSLAKAYYSFSDTIKRTFDNDNLDFARFLTKFYHNFLFDRNLLKGNLQF